MFENLKQIYRNKVIENVTEYDYNKYYYFYKPNKHEVFAIEKTISTNEYQLIQSSYIEKKVYDNDPKNQKIYEYLFEQGVYPFGNKKTKLLVLNKNDEELKEILQNFYQDVKILQLDNFNIAFCFDSYDLDLSKFINSISFDLGQNIKLHDGIYIHPKIEGTVILNYLTIVKEFMSFCEESYTDITSLILNKNFKYVKEYVSIIDTYVMEPVLGDSLTKDIILTYFKNDLNVSQTSKELYMNRSSLLNKFEHILKETGLDLQKFNHACAVYLFIMLKK